MASSARLFGSAASGTANFLLYGTILALWPGLEECAQRLCIDAGERPAVTVHIWRPFIDNPGHGAAPVEPEPTCPVPEGKGDLHRLGAAPLPDGYDPHADRQSPRYVCVLVGRRGEVLDARILRGTGRASLDRELVRTVRQSWRFGAAAWEAKSPSWQRVRLDSGSVNGTVWEPPLLL
ncbi:MAG TPA: hypothetical protein VFZ91_14115 [Allosphingosinicella sp.]